MKRRYHLQHECRTHIADEGRSVSSHLHPSGDEQRHDDGGCVPQHGCGWNDHEHEPLALLAMPQFEGLPSVQPLPKTLDGRLHSPFAQT